MSNIRESMAGRLAQLTGEDIPDDERDVWSLWDEILSVEHRYVTDIVVAIGGPTQMFHVHHNANGEVWKVEYYDSWGTEVGKGATIALNEKETETLLNAIGWHDLELWKEQ